MNESRIWTVRYSPPIPLRCAPRYFAVGRTPVIRAPRRLAVAMACGRQTLPAKQERWITRACKRIWSGYELGASTTRNSDAHISVPMSVLPKLDYTGRRGRLRGGIRTHPPLVFGAPAPREIGTRVGHRAEPWRGEATINQDL